MGNTQLVNWCGTLADDGAMPLLLRHRHRRPEDTFDVFTALSRPG
jgi:hypothetical protein